MKRSEFDKTRLDRAGIWLIESQNDKFDVDDDAERKILFRLYADAFPSNRRKKFYWKHCVEASRIIRDAKSMIDDGHETE